MSIVHLLAVGISLAVMLWSCGAQLPMKEVEEAQEAVKNNDNKNLQEELGDVFWDLIMTIHIAEEEGLKYEIYRCSEGYPTAGIGHLITEWDEEYFDKPIGTEVSKEQVDAWFEKDLNVAIGDMEKFTEGMNVDENVNERI